MADREPDDESEHRPDRRAALTRLGLGAAAAWVAPTILSQSAAAAASGGPPPPGCNGCVGPAVTNPGAELGTPYLTPPDWTFVGGSNITAPYTDFTATVTAPPAPAVPGLNFFFVDQNGLDGVTMRQTLDVNAPCGDGSHAAVLSFWWFAVDFLRASVLFTDGANPLDLWTSSPIGPTTPIGSAYPMASFTSPSIPVPAGTTKAIITFLTVIGTNSNAQVGLDLIDLTIC